MKIGFILPSLVRQAPVMICISLASQFVRLGHDVTIFNFTDQPEVDIPDGIHVRNISFFKPLDFNNFDIIHTHMLRPDLYVFLHTLFRKPRCKLISTLHNYLYPELENYYNGLIAAVVGRMWNLAWTKFDCLVVLTDDAKKYYQKVSFNKKIHRIYNGRDITKTAITDNEFKNLHSHLKSQGLTIIGTYCNLVRRKNVSLLIDHVKKDANCCLVIFGSGPEFKHLKYKVANYGLEARVHLLGYRPDAYNYNQYFDIYAIPSTDEGFGLALIEAALYKKKIVCSDIPVFREIFNDQCVAFFTPNSLESLAQAIAAIRTKSGCEVRAYERAISHFGESTMARQYLDLYKRQLAQ
jgi:glycosyltransferase involved in cell wall biosynthesis